MRVVIYLFFMRTIPLTFLSLALLAITFAVVIVVIQAYNQAKVSSLAQATEELFEHGKTIAAQDSTGGATPQETLHLFAQAISSGDTSRAAALCLPALRDRVSAALKPLSEQDRVAFAREVDGVANAASSTVVGDVYTITEPVYVELVRYPSGVWKIASF